MEDQAPDCSLSFLCKRAHVSKNANDFETQRRRMVERTTGERANRKALVGIKQVHINLCVCVDSLLISLVEKSWKGNKRG